VLFNELPPFFALMQKPVAPKKIKALRRIRLSAFFSVLQGFAHPAYAIFPQDPSFLLRLLRAGAWPLTSQADYSQSEKRHALHVQNQNAQAIMLKKATPESLEREHGCTMVPYWLPVISQRTRVQPCSVVSGCPRGERNSKTIH
jgi:hypothetical protein